VHTCKASFLRTHRTHSAVAYSFAGQRAVAGRCRGAAGEPRCAPHRAEREGGAQAGHAEALAQIDLDLHRTFPDHPLFSGEPRDSAAGGGGAGGGVGTGGSELLGALRRLLRAYARRNRAVGYCQGLNFIAGVMLLFLSEEQAFWLLATLLEQVLHLLPRGCAPRPALKPPNPPGPPRTGASAGLLCPGPRGMQR